MQIVKKYNNHTILILCAIIIFLSLKTCITKPQKQIYIKDTVFIKDSIYISELKPYKTVLIDTVFLFDTIEVLNDYFTVKYYDTTIINDTCAARLKFDVSKNSPRNIYFYYECMNTHIDTFYLNRTQKTEQKKLLFNPYIKSNFKTLHAGVIVIKKNKSYMLEYDLFNKCIFVGAGIVF